MVEVLEPFEKRDCHTASVDEQIRNDENISFEKNLVRCWRRRSVGSLGDDLEDGSVKMSARLPG